VEHASIVADYCLLFTVMDDAAERYFTGSSIDVANGALQDVVHVIAGRAARGGSATEYPRYAQLLEVTADLRSRILACEPTPEMYDLFVLGMDRYRRGVVQQIHMSQRRIPVSRETQLYNRLLNVAMDPTVVLLCMLRGVDVSAEMANHPMMERLHIAICRLSGAMNDIISFPKEVQEGFGHSQYHNLVAANFIELARVEHIKNPLELAIARTFDFHNNEFRDVLEIGSDVAIGRPRIAKYVRLGLDMHRSFMLWCLSADRYRGAIPMQKPIRAERRVRIAWPHKGSREA
jgi:hypothetical protein